MRRSILHSGVWVAGVVLAGQAVAEGTLEEVIVTAEKRAESIQDVPIAVTAYDQSDLDAKLINDAMNLQD